MTASITTSTASSIRRGSTRPTPASGASVVVKTIPARFDAARDTVDQFEATSNDGTKIPYFVVHPKTMALRWEQPDHSRRLWRLPGLGDAELFGDRGQASG